MAVIAGHGSRALGVIHGHYGGSEHRSPVLAEAKHCVHQGTPLGSQGGRGLGQDAGDTDKVRLLED